MIVYETNNELMHYGVLGMKWGQHKYAKQTKKVNKLESKRSKIASRNGKVSNEYIKTSKKLYVEKSKQDLQKAKLGNDSAKKTIAKNDIQFAKRLKSGKTTLSGYFKPDYKKVYGKDLSSDEFKALEIKEDEQMLKIDRKGQRKRKIKMALVPIATIMTASAVAAGVDYFNKNSNVIASKLTPNGVNNANRVINFINKGADFVNRGSRLVNGY